MKKEKDILKLQIMELYFLDEIGELPSFITSKTT